MRSQKGLTLIELLVAMALTSLLALAALKVFSTNARLFTNNVSRSRFQADARLVLKSLTSDIEATTDITEPAVGTMSNTLTLKRRDANNNLQTVEYLLDTDNYDTPTLIRRVGNVADPPVFGAPIELASYLVSNDRPLFYRTYLTYEDSINISMKFRNASINPSSDFKIKTTLNPKRKAKLTLDNQGGSDGSGLSAVYFSDADNGWAVGSYSIRRQYSSGGWSVFEGGSTWNFNSVYMLTDSLGWIVGRRTTNNTGYIRSLDASFTASPPPSTGINLYDLVAEDSNNITVVGANGTTEGFISRFDGSNWNNETPASSPVFKSVSAANDGTMFAVGENDTIYRKPNEGEWAEVASHPDSPVAGRHLNGISIVPQDGGYFVWVVGNAGTIYRFDSLNSTDPWQTITSGTPNNLNSVYFFNENNGYAVGDYNTILRYEKNTAEFERLKSPALNTWGGQDIHLKSVHLYGNDRGWIVGTIGTRIKIGD